jgi:hypothetical protein
MGRRRRRIFVAPRPGTTLSHLVKSVLANGVGFNVVELCRNTNFVLNQLTKQNGIRSRTFSNCLIKKRIDDVFLCFHIRYLNGRF